MSSSIQTSSGSKPVDPYKAKNLDPEASLKEKIEDLVKFIKDTKYGMLTTKASDSDMLTSRAMALAGTVTILIFLLSQGHEFRIEESLTMHFLTQERGGVDLIFFTNLFSGKTMDLTVHPTETNISFLDIPSGAWASISGTTSIISNEEVVGKFYSPSLKLWMGDLGDGVHDGGPSDPRIGVIKMEARSAVHVAPRKGLVGRAVEAGKAMAKGETPPTNKIHEIRTEDLSECE